MALDTKNRGIDIDDVDDDSPTLSEKDGTLYNKDGSRVEPDYRSDSPMDTTKTRNERKMSDEALKKNPLLTPVRIIVLFYFSGTGAGQTSIDNRIEQAMDLVKSHLMNAVRSEVEELKDKINKLEVDIFK